MGTVRLPAPPRAAPLVSVAAGAAVAGIAYFDGSYGVKARTGVAIALWWLVVVAIALGLWRPRLRLARSARLVVGATAALALWTLASALWAPDAEAVLLEFDRVTLYLAVLVIAIAGAHAGVRTWLDGLAGAVTVVSAFGLASRFFPGVFPDRGIAVFLPSAESRLSFPLGYWNGLAIFAAIGVPLLLARAAAPARTAVRAAACAAVPLLAAVIFLASSRGGVLAAAVAVLALVVLAGDRWPVVGATLVSALGAVAEVAYLSSRDVLVHGPFESGPGRAAAAVTVLICCGTGVAWAVASRARVRSPGPAVSRAVVAVVAVAAVVALAFSDPTARFATFKQPPSAAQFSKDDFVQAHLLSGAGSGRWQFWGGAVDQLRSAPLGGGGAASFASWWAQHGSIPYYVQDAHSLYLESFAELGVVGGLLVLALVGGGIVGAVAATRRSGRDRPYLAAATAGFVAWAVGAGVDWMWELTAVTVLGIVLLGLTLAPARAERARLPQRPTRFGAAVAAVVAAWLLLCAQAIPFFTTVAVEASQAAARRGDLTGAAASASTARRIAPWASTPYLQLALVAERRGRLGDAGRWIAEATENSERDWRLWLVAARIETKSGNVRGARAALRRARELNPGSPLFRS